MTILLFIGYKDTLRVPQVWVLERDADGYFNPGLGRRPPDRGQNFEYRWKKYRESYLNKIIGSIALKRDEPLPLTYLHNGTTNNSKIKPRSDRKEGMPLSVSGLFFIQKSEPLKPTLPRKRPD